MKVIHLDSGRRFSMPVSGGHSVSKCGISFQDTYLPDIVRHTKNIDFVTCKKCLRKSKV